MIRDSNGGDAGRGLTSGLRLEDVAATLRGLRDEIRRTATDDGLGGGDPSVANMRAYLVLRRHDNRALQAALARLGLWALGRDPPRRLSGQRHGAHRGVGG